MRKPALKFTLPRLFWLESQREDREAFFKRMDDDRNLFLERLDKLIAHKAKG